MANNNIWIHGQVAPLFKQLQGGREVPDEFIETIIAGIEALECLIELE